MGNATAVRSFALSGGAAGSLIGAVAVVLVVLGAILAFDGDDRSTLGAAEQSVAIQGAPEAAAQAVAPATRAVASTPAPIAAVAAASAPSTFAPTVGPVVVEPPERVPGAPEVPTDPTPAPDQDPPRDCVLNDLLPQCVDPDDPTGGALGNVTGGIDQAGSDLLGVDLGLQDLTAPFGNVLNDPLGSVGGTVDNIGNKLQAPVQETTDNLVGGLNQTLTGVNGLLSGLTGKR